MRDNEKCRQVASIWNPLKKSGDLSSDSTGNFCSQESKYANCCMLVLPFHRFLTKFQVSLLLLLLLGANRFPNYLVSDTVWLLTLT